MRDQYRAELLGRFNALTRRRRGGPGRPAVRQPGSRGGARFAPRPVSAQAKARRARRRTQPRDWPAPCSTACSAFPSSIAAHAEAIAALPLPDRDGRPAARRCCSKAAMAHGELDQERLHTILAEAGGAPLAERLRLERGLAFSFTRRDADPERACRDLVLVIETLAAQPGLDAALEAATARLKEEGDEAAFQEQQRLRAARDEADRQLATLIEGDAGG